MGCVMPALAGKHRDEEIWDTASFLRFSNEPETDRVGFPEVSRPALEPAVHRRAPPDIRRSRGRKRSPKTGSSHVGFEGDVVERMLAERPQHRETAGDAWQRSHQAPGRVIRTGPTCFARREPAPPSQVPPTLPSMAPESRPPRVPSDVRWSLERPRRRVRRSFARRSRCPSHR